jgi:diguanylate cyclase (GGDEF)-like protein
MPAEPVAANANRKRHSECAPMTADAATKPEYQAVNAMSTKTVLALKHQENLMRLPSAPYRRGVTPAESTPFRMRRWASLGALVVVLGSVGAVFGAAAAANNDATASRRGLATSTSQIATNLQLALQHEHDLVISAAAFFLDSENTSETAFLRWASSVQALNRYPELEGFGDATIVPASDLARFAAQSTAAPATGSAPSTRFVVSPPGHRAFYCFSTVGLDRSADVGVPAGFDLCAGAQGRAMFATRDSRADYLQPLTVQGETILFLATPIYRGGSEPSTLALRRGAFVGWIDMSILPDVILNLALHGHPDTAVALRFGGGSSMVAFDGGKAPTNFESTTINLHNGWTIETFAPSISDSLFGDGNALALLLIGILLSAMLGALIYVLGTGRGRAMETVHERTDELQFQALHDSLTGLPNRALLLDRLTQLLARARRGESSCAVMFLDLDDFKDINDTLGHEAGDELLVAVSARLTGTLRSSDTVGRLGGDEFILLVEGAELDAGVEAAANRMLRALDAPFDLDCSDTPLSISASIGVATGSRLTPSEMLRDADIALYRAKAAGKGRFVVFTPSMQASIEDRRQLNVDLQRALATGEFFLVYQPAIDLGTGMVSGVEALLRWRHPERGVVQPNDFIPALEASGLILPVGAWVLEQACAQGAIWQGQGHRLNVAVNISGRQLAADRIVDDVARALAESGLDPTRLTLEMTETSLMFELEEALPQLSMLKAVGVKMAIDNFGTGYSSLAYLRQFPIDILKIDRSFVADMANSAEAAALVHTLVRLGKVLDLETVAEGIETVAHLSQSRAEEIDTGQGFLVSRPIDASAVTRLVDGPPLVQPASISPGRAPARGSSILAT